MSAKFKAVEDIKKLGKYLSGLIEFADELEAIGSLENAAKESEMRIEKCRAEELKAHAAKEEALKNLEAVKQEGESLKASAADKAAAIISKAHAESEKMISGASEQMAKVIADSKLKALEYAKQTDELESRKFKLGEEVKEMQSKYNELKAQLDELKKKFN